MKPNHLDFNQRQIQTTGTAVRENKFGCNVNSALRKIQLGFMLHMRQVALFSEEFENVWHHCLWLLQELYFHMKVIDAE